MLEVESIMARQLKGVEIFTSGVHTDSVGKTREFGKIELAGLASSFGNLGDVPLVLGHTSQEFNDKVAKELGIPTTLLAGEPGTGKGTPRLGQVVNVHANGKLTADFEFANPKVANLISRNFFTDVSVEIKHTEEGPMLSRVALLGGERPAVKGMNPLQNATLLGELEEGSSLYTQTLATESSFAPDSGISGSAQAPDDLSGSGGPIWSVRMRDTNAGRVVQSNVSAPDKVSAGRTALRVLENFLLSATGPLGSIVGHVGGALIARKMIVTSIKKAPAGSKKGVTNWLFEESTWNPTFLVSYLSEKGMDHPVGNMSAVDALEIIWSQYDDGVLRNPIPSIAGILKTVEHQTDDKTMLTFLQEASSHYEQPISNVRSLAMLAIGA